MPKLLPIKHPYRILTNGPSTSGKTYFTLKIIRKYLYAPGIRVLLVCPTAEQQRSYEWLLAAVEKEDFYTDLTEDVFEEVKDKIDNADGPCLLIIDDCSSAYSLNFGRKGTFAGLANNAVHQDLSMVVMTQNLTSISKSFRGNCQLLIQFPSCDKNENLIIKNEFNNTGESPELYQELRHFAFSGGNPHVQGLAEHCPLVQTTKPTYRRYFCGDKFEIELR